jgi:hypothetical protein
MSYMEHPESGLILEVIEWNALTRPYFNGIEKKVKALDASQRVHEFKLSDLTPKFAVFSQLLKFGIKKLLGRIKPTRRAIATAT